MLAKNKIDLSGRVAVVTGGASGIGFATAKRFLQSGAIVEIWGRSAAKLSIAETDLSAIGKVVARTVDVSRWHDVQQASAAAEAAHGRVDILFNNAGVSLDVCPLIDMPLEAWDENIAVNLSGVFYSCRTLVPGMTQRGYGRIINVSSMAGKDGNAFQCAYSAAKAGVIALTKSLAKELATTGIMVNCIAPTLFETPLAQSALERAPGAMEQIREKIPMRRFGLPEEAAAMVAWLASEECSYTTGFTFDLSGGRATY